MKGFNELLIKQMNENLDPETKAFVKWQKEVLGPYGFNNQNDVNKLEKGYYAFIVYIKL